MLKAVICGAVVFPGLFFTFRKILKSALTHWSDGDVVLVSERLVSAIHAIVSTTAGVIVVTSCRDVITDSHWLVNGFSLFGAPYMFHDIYAMYLSYFYTRVGKDPSRAPSGHSLQTVRDFLRKEWVMVVHHLTLVLVFLPIVLFFRKGLGDFFIGCIFIAELSTPFVSLGKILIQLGHDNTVLHKINGFIVLLSFFMCRIMIFPFMYWMYGRRYGIPLHSAPFHLPMLCNLGNLVMLAPQIYWFTLLLKKAKRLYMRQRRGLGDGQKDRPKTD